MCKSQNYLILIILISFPVILRGQEKLDFCRKWNFDGYIYMGILYPPSNNEITDYIYFKNDNTFASINERKFEKGNWKLDSKNITLFLSYNDSEEELLVEVVRLRGNSLIMLVRDEKDFIKMKFRSENE